ncbi:MAG: mannose-phosphate guanylyltransferase [Solirubrobacterales bacterium]|jgi:mannose-1-phosphate guanylyltransferase|nr:mannose-phosphate guanylyltransferase [Solirubrobacterales bacterium]
MQAIVLVGGEGTRLRPLTSDVPKPAVTLVDRPFLAYAIEWLAAHGVTEVVLACGFLPDVLRAALADEEERAGVEITYVAEPEPLGTAGAIRFAADSLGERLEDRFLALNGDVLADLDLSALVRAHEERGARATIGLHPVEDSSAYGLVSCDEEGRVREFLEKTGKAVPGEINAGAYVLDRSVLDLVPAGQAVSIEREVFPRLVGDGLCGLLLEGYWMDIGTPDRYLQASWDILEGRVETQVRPTAAGLLVGGDAVIDEEANVGPRAVVSGGCRIERGAEVAESVLLEGCTVGRDAIVQGSILAPGAEIEPGAQLVNAVVGRDERVPA